MSFVHATQSYQNNRSIPSLWLVSLTSKLIVGAWVRMCGDLSHIRNGESVPKRCIFKNHYIITIGNMYLVVCIAEVAECLYSKTKNWIHQHETFYLHSYTAAKSDITKLFTKLTLMSFHLQMEDTAPPSWVLRASMCMDWWISFLWIGSLKSIKKFQWKGMKISNTNG